MHCIVLLFSQVALPRYPPRATGWSVQNIHKALKQSHPTPPQPRTTSTSLRQLPHLSQAQDIGTAGTVFREQTRTSDLEVLIHITFSQHTAPVHMSGQGSLKPEGRDRRQRADNTLMSVTWTLSRARLHL